MLLIADASIASSQDEVSDPMQQLLVDSDDDLVGHFAYSIHKQHEHDWRLAFREAHGRAPLPAEADEFLLGEWTNRRREQYRREARMRLDEQSQNVGGPVASAQSLAQRSYLAAQREVSARSAAGIAQAGGLTLALAVGLLAIGLALFSGLTLSS